MKSILVPYDFSDFSKEALKFAVSFAEKQKAEITLLYAIYVPVMFVPTLPEAGPLGYDPIFFKNLEDDATIEFEKLVTTINQPSIKINYKIIYGDVATTILSDIELHKPDFVIMGTAGVNQLRGPFVGSTTEKVVRHSEVPVIIIRKAIALKSVCNILYPSELTLNQKDVMDDVKGMQKFFKAKLHILLVNTPAHFKSDLEASEALSEFAKYYQIENYEVHFCSYPTEEAGIVDFAINKNVDFLIMATHGRKGFSRLLYGSITQDVLEKIECPIMTLALNK